MMARAWSLAIAGSVFALDRITKVWIERTVSVWDTHEVIPGFFNIVHTKNRGAAFGMFAEGDSALRPFLLVGVSVLVLIFISFALLKPGREAASRLTFAGLSLLLGGAIGNVYDRVVHGMVTDFLEFFIVTYRFAAFNVADSAITTGAGLLLLDMWMSRRSIPDVSQNHQNG